MSQVLSPCSLCLRGNEIRGKIHHGVTENTEKTKAQLKGHAAPALSWK